MDTLTYRIPKTPGATDGLRLLPALTIAFLLLLGLGFFPQVQHLIMNFDLTCARFMNGLLGHNRMVDLLLAGINSQSGDALVCISFLTLFLVHAFHRRGLESRFERLAYWFWLGALFILIYQFQRLVEGGFSRDSPGKELEPWFNLREVYEVPAKVTNTHSFPSGHATAYYFLAFVTIRRYRLAGAMLLGLALVMPTTRLMTGAHWFSDIFLGSVPIAALLATLVIETNLWKLKRVAEKALWDVWFITSTRRLRSLSVRLRAAWREFRAPESLLRQEHQKGERHTDVIELTRARVGSGRKGS